MKNQFKITLVFTILFSSLSLLFTDLSAGTIKSTFDFNSEKLTINAIQFDTEVLFKEPDHVIFGRITTSAVAPSGMVFMADNSQHKIHVFDADGIYVDSFGRQGSGPGEFQMIGKLIADNHHIHIFDPNQRMVHQFDQNNLRHVRSVSLMGQASQPQAEGGVTMQSGSTFPNGIHLLSNGNYLVTLQDFRNPDLLQTVILSPEGKTVEENRFEFLAKGAEASGGRSGGSMQGMFITNFTRATKLALSGNGLLFSNWNEDLEFTVFDESGNRLRSLTHPYTNAALNRQEVTERLQNLQVEGSGRASTMRDRLLQNVEIPDTWPAVDKIYADKQNRLWVATFTENQDERKWFLFDENGNKLADFTWSSSKNIIHADENALFVQTVDEDELPLVIRYRFELS
jgi:hypothetical protein